MTSFKQKGSLLFKNLERDLSLKMIDLHATYFISTGLVEPNSIELGKIGYANNWEGKSFLFYVQNTANIDLHYELRSSSVVDFVSINGSKDFDSAKGVIPTKEKHLIEAIFKPYALENLSPGKKSFTLDVINLYNPHNIMKLTVMYTLTVFEFKFERLISGELILPPLTYPTLSNSSFSDTWFSIINGTDEDTKFEILYNLESDLSDYFRLEVLSRFSNSPLVGVISVGPRGNFDVRVRISLKEENRASNTLSSFKHFFKADVDFGSIWVIPKNQMNASEYETASKKIAERIPMKCSVVEGPTFMISEKKIEFRILAVSDDENDQINSNAQYVFNFLFLLF